MIFTVYIEDITPRHEYIFGFIFQDIIGLDIRLTADERVVSTAQALLNYSTRDIAGHPYLTPHGLLAQTGYATAPRISVDDEKHFFHVDSDLLDFDLFSASFFLLSRFEEYAAPDVAFDEHGRFRSARSLAVREGFIDRPLIDQWAMELKAILSARYPALEFRERRYAYLCTFDIDVAYAYGGRGGFREVASRMKDLGALDMVRMKERKQVRSGKKKDPYDTYDYQLQMIDDSGVDSRYFFLVGDRGPLDRNLPFDSTLMTDLIQRIAEVSKIGIHPSMASHANAKKLKKEVSRLEKVSGKPLKMSRQHFLSFRLPETFQRLEKAGILEDHSMGYAEALGFRASTCTPHQWYDLGDERISDLRLIPLTVMDSTLKDYLGLSPEQAVEEVVGLIEKVKAVDGVFVSLWHNHSLNDQGEWSGWKMVFERTVSGAAD